MLVLVSAAMQCDRNIVLDIVVRTKNRFHDYLTCFVHCLCDFLLQTCNQAYCSLHALYVEPVQALTIAQCCYVCSRTAFHVSCDATQKKTPQARVSAARTPHQGLQQPTPLQPRSPLDRRLLQQALQRRVRPGTRSSRERRRYSRCPLRSAASCGLRGLPRSPCRPRWCRGYSRGRNGTVARR
jgi:hypothetical protein